MTTAVILAGGKSRRMGRDKQTLTFNGKTFLQAAADRFSEKFDKVYISIADPDKYAGVPYEKITDTFPGCGPMAGLHATLSVCQGEGVFLIAADLPFSSPDAAMKIIELCGDADIAIMKDADGRYEPLFAYYKKSLLPRAEVLLRDGRYKMLELFDTAKLRIIDRAELGDIWSEEIIMNVNYPEDYERLVNGK